MASNLMTTVSTWKGGALFEHIPPSGVKYMTDAKLPAFPKESLDGPGPMEVLLGALTGCTGYDVVNTLSKMRMEIKSFRLEVEAERVPKDPRIFNTIHVVYHIETDPVDTAKVRRAIALSAGPGWLLRVVRWLRGPRRIDAVLTGKLGKRLEVLGPRVVLHDGAGIHNVSAVLRHAVDHLPAILPHVVR